MGSDRRFFKNHDAKFLLTADLADPDARVGRRKRARLQRGEAVESELSAEKRPRSQNQWVDEQRKLTKLPTSGDSVAGVAASDAAPTPKGADVPADSGIGRKKQKRLAVLEAKKAKKAQKQVSKDRRANEDAAEKVKGKAKGGQVSATAAELLERCKGGVAAEQRLLAKVAERIAAAPEKELDCFDVFFELHSKGSDARTRQLALLSSVAVFRDLVPGYRIREPTEQEKAQQRSKPVLALERYELGLLQKYRQLLPALEAALKRDPIVFAPALSALIQAASEFNYRQRLITTAVRHAGSHLEAVRTVVAEGLRNMVEGDQRLEASRELVLAVGRVAQGAAATASRGGGGGSLKQELVEVLLRLPIGRAATLSLQEGALDVEADEDVRKGITEASITHGSDKVKKAEAELLTEVFVVYLRILRQRQAHGRGLLGSALTGLSRWGQQVNIELLLEILVELKGAVKDALERGDELVALQGLYCALVLLSGDSRALVTDVTWLADALKTGLTLALPSLHSAHSEGAVWPPARCFRLEEEEDGGQMRLRACSKELRHALEADSVPALVLRCLDAALRCPQAYGRASDSSLASLVEQLFLLAADADAHVGVAMLREAAFLLRKHRKLYTLLDVEGGLFGLGGVTENAVTVAWHLQALAFSLLPEAARAGRALPSVIPRHQESIANLFPSRDGQAWLASEVARHFGASLNDASVVPPGSAAGANGQASAKSARGPRAAAFLSEAELISTCGAPV